MMKAKKQANGLLLNLLPFHFELPPLNVIPLGLTALIHFRGMPQKAVCHTSVADAFICLLLQIDSQRCK